MTKLAIAVLLSISMHASYAFGLFPRHHHHDFGGGAAPARNSDIIPPIPEPETYLFMLVGVGVAAWIIRKNKK